MVHMNKFLFDEELYTRQQSDVGRELLQDFKNQKL